MVSKGETLNEANLNEEKICDKANMEEEDIIDTKNIMTSEEENESSKDKAIPSCSSASRSTYTHSWSPLLE